MPLKHPNAIPAGLIPSGTDDNFDYYVKYEESANTLTFYSDPAATDPTDPPGCVTAAHKDIGHIFVMTSNSEGVFADPVVTWQGQNPDTTPPSPIHDVIRSGQGEGFAFTDRNVPTPENDTTYHFTIWVQPDATQQTGAAHTPDSHKRLGPVGFGVGGSQHGFDPTVVNKGENSGGGIKT